MIDLRAEAASRYVTADGHEYGARAVRLATGSTYRRPDVPDEDHLIGAGVHYAGFIETNPSLETSMPGVFAAGDVRQGGTKQAASAAGEGATTALMLREYLNQM